ncbi:MAG: hypothetical protein J5526_08030 [Bacteroidales bacterium]|nr:hypothetical protein [Bacteroidales bacterium]
MPTLIYVGRACVIVLVCVGYSSVSGSFGASSGSIGVVSSLRNVVSLKSCSKFLCEISCKVHGDAQIGLLGGRYFVY